MNKSVSCIKNRIILPKCHRDLRQAQLTIRGKRSKGFKLVFAKQTVERRPRMSKRFLALSAVTSGNSNLRHKIVFPVPGVPIKMTASSEAKHESIVLHSRA